MYTNLELKIISRQAKINLARRHFWDFCKIREPEFYRDERWHLHLFAVVLELLYCGLLTKDTFEQAVKEIAPKWYYDSIDWSKIKDDHIFKKLITNLPPQHGKSRTLVNFEAWSFGKNVAEKVINGSYNDMAAKDFSRYTRDAIQEKSHSQDDIVYSDIFPETKIKRGNAAYGHWALEGQHFSYLGSGIGGTLTGKGGTILVVDDPVKDAETAFNIKALDRIWQWYAGTFISRVSAEDGEPLEIVNHTRWATKDVCGRILNSEDADNWLVLLIPAESPTGEMLCESLLSKRRFEYLKKNMVPEILAANYYHKPVDIKGLLFPPDQLKRFKMAEIAGKIPEARIVYVDVADEGSDFVSAPIGFVWGDKVYIVGVVFSQEPIEYTQPPLADKIVKNQVDRGVFESNNGGRQYMISVSDLVRSMGFYPDFEAIPNTSNKQTRILVQAGYVKDNFYFLEPDEQDDEYKLFMQWLCSYVKKGKNEHDDAPDSLAGLAALCRHGLNMEIVEGNYY